MKWFYVCEARYWSETATPHKLHWAAEGVADAGAVDSA
jgi:hypothetical protein